jgi:hypothetical protein
MLLANRSVLAILYTALVFGAISCPYYYVMRGALSYFPPRATWIIFAWLPASTAVLLLVFISKTKLEERLATKFGRYFQPILIVAVFLALGSACFLEAKIANFTLLLPVEYWYYLILISGVATVVAVVVIVLTRPSRLEQLIAAKVRGPNKSQAIYQTVGYLVLILGLVFAYSRLHQYYLSRGRPSP